MKKRAFTLVELMIVVVILGILAAIVVPQFSDASTSARLSNLTSNLSVVRRQLELYKMQHNHTYPTAAQFPDVLTTKTNYDGTTTGTPTLGPYLERLPDNSYTNANSVGNGVIGSSDWYYDESTGVFRANDDAGHVTY